MMTLGIILARRFHFPNLLIVILGAVVLVNGLTHTISSLIYTEYVPGLMTSILLWIPLGIITLVSFKGAMHKARYWLCVALGIGINGIIEVVASKAGQVF